MVVGSMQKLIRTLVACVAFVTASAQAVPIVADIVGGGGPFDTYYSSVSGDVVGFAFTADVDLSVTALGMRDYVDGVLNTAHMVGLWDLNSQALIASLWVDATGTLIDGFYYTNLPSTITLFANTSYVLGALYSFQDGDAYISGPSSVTSNYVTILNAVFPGEAELGFVFPTGVSNNSLGRFGPNLLVNPLVNASTPATLGIFVLGLIAMRLRRR